MRYWNCYRCGRQIPFDGKIKVIDGQVYHPNCPAKSPADLAQPGASAERISSVVRLLPCPFCGDRADVICEGTVHYIKCKCGVRTGYFSEETAIKMWNERK